jgi:hypothetical protein
LRAQCDLAEHLWGLALDRQEALRLAALACRAGGAKGLEDYQPPSEALAEWLAGDAAAEAPARGEDRALQIAALAAALGGEAG